MKGNFWFSCQAEGCSYLFKFGRPNSNPKVLTIGVETAIIGIREFNFLTIEFFPRINSRSLTPDDTNVASPHRGLKFLPV